MNSRSTRYVNRLKFNFLYLIDEIKQKFTKVTKKHALKPNFKHCFHFKYNQHSNLALNSDIFFEYKPPRLEVRVRVLVRMCLFSVLRLWIPDIWKEKLPILGNLLPITNLPSEKLPLSVPITSSIIELLFKAVFVGVENVVFDTQIGVFTVVDSIQRVFDAILLKVGH